LTTTFRRIRFAMTERDFSYGEVEDLLAAVLEIRPEGRQQLRARLRHLRNLGVPDLPKLGSGIKLRYSKRQAFEMLIAVGLETVGQTPRKAAALSLQVSEAWHKNQVETDALCGFVIVTPENQSAAIPGVAGFVQSYLRMGISELPFSEQDAPLIYSSIDLGKCWKRLHEALRSR
jgi:hypothetical protein